MSIIVKNSSMVCPAEETPKKNLWLSRLDMIYPPFTHSRQLFVYIPNTSGKNCTTTTTFFDTKVLKKSLSNLLVAYYPFAGRLKMNEVNGRYEINCNAEGVLFVEAETSSSIDEFHTNDDFRKLLSPQCDYSKGLGSFPLMMMQVTRFKSGEVCLATVGHHHVLDGISGILFFSSWARLARGLDIGIMPVHDRATYLGPRCPPQIKFKHSDWLQSLPPLRPTDSSGNVYESIEGVFVLSKYEIDVLKQEARSSKDIPKDYNLSTFEILAAHVWRCATKVRGLADDQDVKLYVPTNARPWLEDPILPLGYIGNAVAYPNCTIKAKEVMHTSLGHVASKVHEMMANAKDSEYLRSGIDYLESQPDLRSIARTVDSVSSPNLSVNSWTSFPYEEADFGWGEPTFLRNGGLKAEGQSFFVKSTEGSLSLIIRLFTPHMALFGNYFNAARIGVEKDELRLPWEAKSMSRL